MAKTKQTDLEAMMGKRLSYARKRLETIIERSKVYRPFIEGDAPMTLTDDSDLETVKQEEREVGRGWRMTSIPAHGMLRQVLLPSLVARAPTFVNRGRPVPANATPMQAISYELERRRGEVFVQLAKAIYREYDVQRQVLAAVDDALLTGVGWLEVDFDPERKLPRIRWHDAQRVLVDCETINDPFGACQRWRAVCWTMPVSDARVLAASWGAKSYEFQPITERVQQRTDSWEPDDMPTEFVRLVRVYVKGDSPWLPDADITTKSGGKVETVGDDDVYKGKDELLVFEARGDFDDEEQYRFIARMPWKFPVDHDDFPLQPLKFTHCNDSFYSYSFYQPGHSLQVALNWAMRYYNTDCMNSARRLIMYDKAALSKETMDHALFGTDALPCIPTNKGQFDAVFRSVEFGKPAPQLQEAIGGNLSQYRDVTGLSAFDAETRSHSTATDAAIRNEGAQLRIGALADRVEEMIRHAMRKALMAARALMTADDVARWIGEDALDIQEQLMPDGSVLRTSPLWDEEADTATIRREVDVHIEPRSVRFVSPEQEISDIERMVGKNLELLRVVQETNVQNPQLAAAIAKAGNAALAAFAERLHLPNADDMMVDLRAAATAPIPQTPPPQVSQTMSMTPDGGQSLETTAPVESMGTGPAGELAGLVQSLGLNPANVPGDLGAAVASRLGGGM